jgi:hypothetical protein
MTLETSLGRMIVTQVVGLVARRIVPYVKAGSKVKKGERIGMIRFGSRVDLFVPYEGLLLAVHEGDRVLAGTTTLAELETEDKAKKLAGGKAEARAGKEAVDGAKKVAGGKANEKVEEERGKPKEKAGKPGDKAKRRPR